MRGVLKLDISISKQLLVYCTQQFKDKLPRLTSESEELFKKLTLYLVTQLGQWAANLQN